MPIDFTKPLDRDTAISVFVGGLLVLGLLGLGGWLGNEWYHNQQSQRRAQQHYECDRDVAMMRGGATEFETCLRVKGWGQIEALQAANHYWLIHH